MQIDSWNEMRERLRKFAAQLKKYYAHKGNGS